MYVCVCVRVHWYVLLSFQTAAMINFIIIHGVGITELLPKENVAV